MSNKRRAESLRSHVHQCGNVIASDLEGLKRRRVVDHKRDGRCIYDEAAKSELVEMCWQPGAAVSRLARECGINANQVSRWLREDAHKRKRSLLARCTPAVPPFVAVPVLPVAVMSAAQAASETAPTSQEDVPTLTVEQLH